ncbi:hypothetical protein SAMN05428965_1175 [Geodermatophilus sp. DSM 45219]|nr:hypothetical protein SAMN05428965_1175 [Geodermatophilus sp. DSM 45219]
MLVEAGTADAIVAAVTACPAVASLHGGGLRRTATYLPGRLVEGVHVDDDRVRVSVVAVQGVPVAQVAEQVRAAVAPLVPGRAVDVHVADVQVTHPPAPPPA